MPLHVLNELLEDDDIFFGFIVIYIIDSNYIIK